MRARVAVLVLLVLTAPIWGGPLSSQCSASGVEYTVHASICEVCPAKPEEFVTVVNDGPSELNASRMKLTDGEGTLTLPPVVLLPGETLTVSKNSTGFLLEAERKNLFAYTDPEIIRKGLFALADDGDQAVLLLDDLAVDSFCYGSASPPEGWGGETFKFIDKGHMATHSSLGKVGGNAKEWTSSVIGRRLFDQANVSSAMVASVIHPEDGIGPLLQMISDSTDSIMLCVYTLDDPDIACALANASERGVDVDVLLEGQPVGGITAFGKRAVVTLLKSGVDVSMFLSNGTYRRYEYVHAKYAIFDSRTVSISSENWGGGLSSNRGWGAMIESEEAAAQLKNVFLADSDASFGDVQPAVDYDADPFVERCPSDDGQIGEWVQADVSIITSPQRSIDPIRGMVRGASEQICIEAMSMDMEWMKESGLLDDIFEAARSGVRVQILLDRSNQYDENMAAASQLLEAAKGLPVECKVASAFHDFTTIHNKGIVVDDRILISSINLGNYAFNENREVGVIIGSEVLSEELFGKFQSDWLDDGEMPTIVLSSTHIECDEGEGIIIDAGRSFDNSAISNYSWDIGGDGIAEGYGPVFSFRPGPGESIVMLRVSDDHGNTASEAVTITASPNEGLPLTKLMIAAPAAAVGSALAIRTLRKRIKSKQ